MNIEVEQLGGRDNFEKYQLVQGGGMCVLTMKINQDGGPHEFVWWTDKDIRKFYNIIIQHCTTVQDFTDVEFVIDNSHYEGQLGPNIEKFKDNINSCSHFEFDMGEYVVFWSKTNDSTRNEVGIEFESFDYFEEYYREFSDMDREEKNEIIETARETLQE